MRSLFPGSYPPSDDDFKLMWSEGMFVFDTSMLLNFYRYSEETRREFLDIVSAPEMAPRVWIPYRVAEEYHRNLDTVRYEQVAVCHKARAIIEEWAKSSRAGDHKKRARQLLDLAEQFVAEAEEQYRHPDRLALIERIADLFEGKVGPEWDDKRLSDLFKEGEKRYRSKVPPGFKDKSKQDDDQYGDLIVWFQIIEEAEKRKKPVVFVTDDLKEDWWLRVGGQTVGPLPALRNEMYRKAGVPFYMYSGDRFLDHARTSLTKSVRDETVAEVKQVREEQQLQVAEESLSGVDALDTTGAVNIGRVRAAGPRRGSGSLGLLNAFRGGRGVSAVNALGAAVKVPVGVSAVNALGSAVKVPVGVSAVDALGSAVKVPVGVSAVDALGSAVKVPLGVSAVDALGAAVKATGAAKTRRR